MSEKTAYRLRNWAEYNQSLINRGDITLWFSDEVIEHWHAPSTANSRGAPKRYSDMAIECMLLLRSVFNLTLRAAQGFTCSLVKHLSAAIQVPHYTTLCRRHASLGVALKPRSSEGARDIVVDATGLKVYGEGEWKVRKHGVSKRRTWRKIHLGIDADSHDIVACVVTENDVGDNEVFRDLIEQIEDPIHRIYGDGAYDTRAVYRVISDRHAQALIRPRKGAKIWRHGNAHGERHNRDENLRYVRKHSMKKWKKDSGYHKRSLAETGMFRLKQLMGNVLASRTFERQAVEVFIRCKAINVMTGLGMPESYTVD